MVRASHEDWAGMFPLSLSLLSIASLLLFLSSHMFLSCLALVGERDMPIGRAVEQTGHIPLVRGPRSQATSVYRCAHVCWS